MINSADEISVVQKGEHVEDYDGIVREGLDVIEWHVTRTPQCCEMWTWKEVCNREWIFSATVVTGEGKEMRNQVRVGEADVSDPESCQDDFQSV